MSTIEFTPAPLGALRARAVAWPLAASVLGRLPVAALGLILLLQTRTLGGSYGLAGGVAAALGLGLALGAPLLGRLADRRGGAPVLVGATAASVVVLLTIAALPRGTAIVVLLPLAAIAGIVHPPVGGIIRSAWPRLLAPRAAERVFAVESSALELTYIAGPAVLGGAVAARSPSLALVLSAGLLVLGAAAMLTHGGLRRATRAPRSEAVGGSQAGASRVGAALASPGLLVLTVSFAGLGASLGAVEVAVAATANRAGDQAAAGLLLATWGLGSLLGGVLLARHPGDGDPRRRLIALVAASGILHGAVALIVPFGLPVLAGALFVAGMTVAPGFAIAYGLTARIAPAHASTEAFSWLSTGIAAGVAAGSALAGILADGPGPRLAYVAGGVAPLAACLLLHLRRADLVTPSGPCQAAATRPVDPVSARRAPPGAGLCGRVRRSRHGLAG